MKENLNSFSPDGQYDFSEIQFLQAYGYITFPVW